MVCINKIDGKCVLGFEVSMAKCLLNCSEFKIDYPRTYNMTEEEYKGLPKMPKVSSAKQNYLDGRHWAGQGGVKK